jgi:hypothetical protein
MHKQALVLAAACAAFLAVATHGAAAAGHPDAVCGTSEENSFFTGTARNLIVPSGGECTVANATITHDLVLGSSRLNIAAATIGHDVRGSQPRSIQTSGVFTPEDETVLGPVDVNHDVLLEGSPGPIFAHDLCDLHVGHDFVVSGQQLNFGMSIGDTDSDEGCSLAAGTTGSSNTIGHDLVITDNAALSNPFFGASSIDVGNNTVGHDLIVRGNTATANLEVSDNVVGHDALCYGNSPAPSADDPADGPNVAGHRNTCG